MLATPGPYWLDGRRSDARWLSTGVSVAATVSLFVAALASMRSTSSWMDRGPRELPPVMIPLSPPPPLPTPPRRETRPARPRPAPPTIVPKEIAPPPSTVVPVTEPVPVAAPAAPQVQRADTTNARGARSDAPTDGTPRPADAAPASPSARLGAAPFAPAGVTGAPRSPLTPERRASLLAPRMLSIQELARQPATGNALAEQQLAQRQAEALGRRVSTAGNSGDLHVPTGGGTGGTGAPVATMSLPFPIFEPGPSAAQRKRDSVIDADNRARLARLMERLASMRDSVHSDSLRRDSLAKRRIVP